eukprot:3266620-Prymnesium_polylepis.1
MALAQPQAHALAGMRAQRARAPRARRARAVRKARAGARASLSCCTGAGSASRSGSSDQMTIRPTSSPHARLLRSGEKQSA